PTYRPGCYNLTETPDKLIAPLRILASLQHFYGMFERPHHNSVPPITLPHTKTFAYETPIFYYQLTHHCFLWPDQLWTHRKYCSKKHDGHHSRLSKFRCNDHLPLFIDQA